MLNQEELEEALQTTGLFASSFGKWPSFKSFQEWAEKYTALRNGQPNVQRGKPSQFTDLLARQDQNRVRRTSTIVRSLIGRIETECADWTQREQWHFESTSDDNSMLLVDDTNGKISIRVYVVQDRGALSFQIRTTPFNRFSMTSRKIANQANLIVAIQNAMADIMHKIKEEKTKRARQEQTQRQAFSVKNAASSTAFRGGVGGGAMGNLIFSGY